MNMFGMIMETSIRNIPYFTIVGLVYMKSGCMALECTVFFIITIAMEVRLHGGDCLVESEALEMLIELDEKLRIGDSPGYAYQKVLRDHGIESMVFECQINRLSQYSWMIEKEMNKEMDFNYWIFHRVLNLLIEENHWRNQLRQLVKKNWIQLEIMKYLPLFIELIMIQYLTFNLGIYSLSMGMLMVANTVSYMMYREIGL